MRIYVGRYEKISNWKILTVIYLNFSIQYNSNSVVFKLCAAALWGAVRNLKGAANFFRQDEILQFFYRNLLGCAAKFFWSLLGCREPKSLKTTVLIHCFHWFKFLTFQHFQTPLTKSLTSWKSSTSQAELILNLTVSNFVIFIVTFQKFYRGNL